VVASAAKEPEDQRRDAPLTLYARVLGVSWLQVAEPLRFAHTPRSIVRAGGRLRVEHGRTHGARLLARLLGLPRASDASDARLIVTSAADGERWLRTFDDRPFDTRQYQTGESQLAERIGLLEFRFRLAAAGSSLLFRQVGAAIVLGPVRLRLPAACAPIVDAREDPAGARQIRIHVRVTLPLLGPVLTYGGTVDYEYTPA